MAKPGVSVIITNYNSRAIIGETVSHVEKAAAAYDGAVEIILVDDASPDGDGPHLRETFSSHQVIVNESGQGYSGANNTGVRASAHDIVVTLNSDMLLAEDFFNRVVLYFDDEDVFAVAAQTLTHETGEHEGGCNGLGFYHGHFLPYRETGELLEKARLSSHPGGGSTYRKSLFLRFGGYAELYAPFYWEDSDLGMRAYSEGYRIAYAPECRISHKHRGSIRSNFSDRRIRTIQLRNRNLFLWKWTRPLSLYRILYLLWLPLWIAADLLRGRTIEMRALWMAWRRRPVLLAERQLGLPAIEPRRVMQQLHRDRCMLEWEDTSWARARRIQFPELFADRWLQLVRMAGSGKKVLAVNCPSMALSRYLLLNGNEVSVVEPQGTLPWPLREQVAELPRDASVDTVMIGAHADPFSVLQAHASKLNAGPDSRILLTIANAGGLGTDAEPGEWRADWDVIADRLQQAGFELVRVLSAVAPGRWQQIISRLPLLGLLPSDRVLSEGVRIDAEFFQLEIRRSNA